MKKKLMNPIIAGMLLLGLMVSFSACTPESDIEETQWKVINIRVEKKNWEWNKDTEQWEAFADLPELSQYIYENGAALGYVFLGTQGKDEVQKPLPYLNTYYDGNDLAGNPVFYTETISCDFQLGSPSTVGFFIKSSDLYDDPNAPQDYNFRIVLIW